MSEHNAARCEAQHQIQSGPHAGHILTCTRKAGHDGEHYDGNHSSLGTEACWPSETTESAAAAAPEGDHGPAERGRGHEPPAVLNPAAALAMLRAGRRTRSPQLEALEVQEQLARLVLLVQAAAAGGRLTQAIVIGMWAIEAGVPLHYSVDYVEGEGLVARVGPERAPSPEELIAFESRHIKAAKAAELRASLSGGARRH